jgi:hypothetical protein
MATLVQKPGFFGELFIGISKKKPLCIGKGTNSPKLNLQGEIFILQKKLKLKLKGKGKKNKKCCCLPCQKSKRNSQAH